MFAVRLDYCISIGSSVSSGSAVLSVLGVPFSAGNRRTSVCGTVFARARVFLVIFRLNVPFWRFFLRERVSANWAGERAVSVKGLVAYPGFFASSLKGLFTVISTGLCP